MPAKLDRRAFLGSVLALGAVCALEPEAAFGVTAAEKQAEVTAVKEKLDAISAEVEEAAEGYNTAMIAYDAATAKVEENEAKIAKAEKKISRLQGHLETRATSMYRTGSMSYLDVLLGAASFGDFATLWDTLNSLNADDADLVSSTKLAKQELKEAQEDLDAQQAEAASQLATAKSCAETAEAKEAEYQAEYNALSSEYQQLVAAEKEAEEAALAAASAAYEPTRSSSSSEESSEEYVSYSGNNAAVARAYAEIGKPYSYGAVGPEAYDCSGLVSYCISGSHTRIYTAAVLWGHASCAEVAGAPVACSSGHCGLAIGGSRMIHAPQTGYTVCIAALRGHCVVP